MGRIHRKLHRQQQAAELRGKAAAHDAEESKRRECKVVCARRMARCDRAASPPPVPYLHAARTIGQMRRNCVYSVCLYLVRVLMEGHQDFMGRSQRKLHRQQQAAESRGKDAAHIAEESKSRECKVACARRMARCDRAAPPMAYPHRGTHCRTNAAELLLHVLCVWRRRTKAYCCVHNIKNT